MAAFEGAFVGDGGDDESVSARSGSLAASAMDTAASSDSGVEPELGLGDMAASAMVGLEEASRNTILPEMDEIYGAKDRLYDYGVMRTPLVRLNADMVRVAHDGMCGGMMDVYLKLENLQPTGSFELRGACNALATQDPEDLKRGIVTASTGNFAQVG